MNEEKKTKVPFKKSPDLKMEEKSDLNPSTLPALWDEYCLSGYKHVTRLKCLKHYWRTWRDLLVPQSDIVVLDGGCGTGAMFPLIFKKMQPRKIVAVDWSKRMLEETRKNAKNLTAPHSNMFEFLQIDLAQPYPWPDAYFDAEIYSLSICYLPTQNWKETLKEAYRTIKPNGYLYMSILFKGWNFSAFIKSKAVGELIANPIHCIKALGVKNTTKKIQKCSDYDMIDYPATLEEFLNILTPIGFEGIVNKTIFEGGGTIIRARKMKS